MKKELAGDAEGRAWEEAECLGTPARVVWLRALDTHSHPIDHGTPILCPTSPLPKSPAGTPQSVGRIHACHHEPPPSLSRFPFRGTVADRADPFAVSEGVDPVDRPPLDAASNSAHPIPHTSTDLQLRIQANQFATSAVHTRAMGGACFDLAYTHDHRGSRCEYQHSLARRRRHLLTERGFRGIRQLGCLLHRRPDFASYTIHYCYYASNAPTSTTSRARSDPTADRPTMNASLRQLRSSAPLARGAIQLSKPRDVRLPSTSVGRSGRGAEGGGREGVLRVVRTRAPLVASHPHPHPRALNLNLSLARSSHPVVGAASTDPSARVPLLSGPVGTRAELFLASEASRVTRVIVQTTTYTRTRTKASTYEHRQVDIHVESFMTPDLRTAVHLRVTSAVPAVNGGLACVHFVGDARQSERKDSIDYARSSHAKLLPLATALVYFGSKAPG
ncbi:hypothetical protein BJ912DRAFT_1147926 [Pholiota molesta]|nr:hypothetical protein BJ912DRAFT_1147926 [Pholiota molesta]